MNLIFQNGDFFSSDSNLFSILNLAVTFFGILSGAFFAVFILWKAERIKQDTENERIKDIENYLKGFVTDVKAPIEKQIELLGEAIKSINAVNQLGYTFQYVSNINTEEIDWITKQDRYVVFVKNRKGESSDKTKLLRKFNATCSYLNTFVPEFKEFKTDFMSTHADYEKQWAINIKKIGEIKDEMLAQYMISYQTNIINEGQEPFLFHLNRIILTWFTKENNLYINVAMEHFINPLIQICNSHPQAKESLNLLKSATECRDAFSNMDVLKKFNTETLNVRIGKLKDTIADLGKCISDLNKMEISIQKAKSFWRFSFETVRKSK